MAVAADWPKMSQKCTFILHFGKRFGKQNWLIFVCQKSQNERVYGCGNRELLLYCATIKKGRSRTTSPHVSGSYKVRKPATVAV